MWYSHRTLVYLCATSLQRDTTEPAETGTLQNLVPVSLWSDIADPVFDGVELAGFKSRANVFLLA